jgi:hypothetical protein
MLDQAAGHLRKARTGAKQPLWYAMRGFVAEAVHRIPYSDIINPAQGEANEQTSFVKLFG